MVEGNTISVGVKGVVVAADLPNTIAKNNIVAGNTMSKEFIPGIIVHSNAPGDTLIGTVVANNTLSSNGPDDEIGESSPAGIHLLQESLL